MIKAASDAQARSKTLVDDSGNLMAELDNNFVGLHQQSEKVAEQLAKAITADRTTDSYLNEANANTNDAALLLTLKTESQKEYQKANNAAKAAATAKTSGF